MRRSFLILAATVLVITAGGVSAQNGESESGLSEMLAQLTQAGWSEANLEAFSAEASRFDWSDVPRSRAEIVAFALSYFNDQTQIARNPESAALLALELAEIASTMEQSGFADVDVARAIVEGLREAADEGLAADPARNREAFAASVRNQIVLRVENQIRVFASGRGPAPVRDTIDRIGEPAGIGNVSGDPPDAFPGGPFGPANE